MPDSTTVPLAGGFDLATLAETLLRHRLAQADFLALFNALPGDAERASRDELLRTFRDTAGIAALPVSIERRAAPSDSLRIVTSGLTAAMRVRRCRLILADPRRGVVTVRRGDGSLEDEHPRTTPCGTSQKVMADGVSRVARPRTDAEDEPGFERPAGGESPREMMCVALRHAGTIAGVVELLDKACGSFNEADRLVAEAAAPVIAELAAQAGLLAPSDGGAREPLRLLAKAELAEDISGRDLILSKILAVAVDVLDADRALIFLHDPQRDELYTRYAEWLGPRELRIDAGFGLVGAAFRTGDLVNVADAYHDVRFNPTLDWEVGYRTRSVLCAPIHGSDGKRVGVVQIFNRRRGNFTAADERRLRGLASQMGITIDYAALFEQTLSMKSYNESMLRSLSNGVVTVDLARVVTFVNQAAARILRLDMENAVGRRLGDIFDGLNAWIIQAVEEASADGVERMMPNSEFYFEEDDAWVPANLTLVPLRDGKQTPLGTMIVIEDLQRENELRRTMSRYLSNEVIDRLMSGEFGGLEGSSHEVTILFSDIRGYTALAERLGAGETVAMLNEYFSFMEDVVTNRGGIIDKYMGDAIMALFGSPFPSDNDAGNAVRGAIDMFQALQILNARRAAGGKAAIRIGVGIGTGNVVAGNIGSPKRADFTVIGDAVNLAARLEAATKTYGADILVCGTTWSRLASPPRARRIDVVRLRGQSRPTDLWEIVEHRPDIPEAALEAYAGGLDFYQSGRWAPALRCFDQAAELWPNDQAAAVMAERCRRFRAAEPADWDGVVDLD